MLYTLKRLTLGIVLITAASALLLYADRGQRRSAQALVQQQVVKRVAILQHANTVVLDDGLRGTIDALAARGYVDGARMTVTRLNAQGDMPTGIAMAQQAVAGGYDLVITSSTPSMQAVANNNREGRVKHVFTLVADPFAANIGLDRANPLHHPAHLIGQGVFPPVEKAFQTARQMLPALQRIGVAWNPSETNSQVFVRKAREVVGPMQLELLEANVDTTSALNDAINSLIVRGAQAIWIGGDNTVIAGVNTVIAIAGRSRIPVFTILPGAPDRGTLFDAGPDFYAVGQQGGLLAADVLDGADITKLPVRDVLDVTQPYLSINTKVLANLKEPWRVSDELLKEATVVVNEQGVQRKAAATPAPAASARPLMKKWNLHLVQLNRTLDVEEAEHGVLDGLKEAGLVEGKDYTKTIRDAQGDMATVTALVDTAISERTDLLLTFSTPTLQAAVQRAKSVPVVFNYVSNPILAGAGKNDKEHAPNIAGVYLIGAYGQMVSLLREYMPGARVFGTVYVPAEVNMVANRDAMLKEFQAAGFELRSVAANSTAEVGEAALALVAGKIDAIVQIPGNLTAAAFPSIAQVSMRAKVPVFAFQTSQVINGAVAAVSRDYYDSGRAAARIAARVMRGESPASIPFEGFAETSLVINVASARTLGVTTPPAVLKRADKVIGK